MKIDQNTANIALSTLIAITLSVGPAWSQQAPQSDDSADVNSTLVKNPELVRDTEHDNFIIGNEDVLAINVWKEPEISRAVPVRSDGKISLPLAGELQAAGKTPKQLEAEIGAGLKSYIAEPEVTVIVQEIRSQKFNILGHVQKPGSYVLVPPMTVVDAIAVAGGFRDFAKVKSIYVLRDDGGKQVRLPFNYKQVIKGSHSGQNIQVQPRDTIVVP